MKTHIHKDIRTPTSTAALFIVPKTGRPPKCPSIEDCIEKVRYISTVVYYSAIRKDETLPFATTWMDLET